MPPLVLSKLPALHLPPPPPLLRLQQQLCATGEDARDALSEAGVPNTQSSLCTFNGSQSNNHNTEQLHGQTTLAAQEHAAGGRAGLQGGASRAAQEQGNKCQSWEGAAKVQLPRVGIGTGRCAPVPPCLLEIKAMGKGGAPGSSGVLGERVSLQAPQKAWGFQRAERQSLKNKLKKKIPGRSVVGRRSLLPCGGCVFPPPLPREGQVGSWSCQLTG